MPQIAAVQQNRIAGTGFAAQPIDQGLHMGEAAHVAVAMGSLLIIEEGEGIRRAATRLDAEMLEKCLADQMRRLAGHCADADIDARLAEIDRQKLRVAVGHMQHAGIAESPDIVRVVGGRKADTRHDAGERRRRESLSIRRGDASQHSSMPFQVSG